METVERKPVTPILMGLKPGESASWPIEQFLSVRATINKIKKVSRGALRFTTNTNDGKSITVTRIHSSSDNSNS